MERFIYFCAEMNPAHNTYCMCCILWCWNVGLLYACWTCRVNGCHVYAHFLLRFQCVRVSGNICLPQHFCRFPFFFNSYNRERAHIVPVSVCVYFLLHTLMRNIITTPAYIQFKACRCVSPKCLHQKCISIFVNLFLK